MKMVSADCENNCTVSVMRGAVQRKFKIPIATIRISALPSPQSSVFFMWVANWRSRATNAVEATDSVRSRR